MLAYVYASIANYHHAHHLHLLPLSECPVQVIDDDLPPSRIPPSNIAKTSNSHIQSQHELHHIRCSPVSAAGSEALPTVITVPVAPIITYRQHTLLHNRPTSCRHYRKHLSFLCKSLPTALCLFRLRIRREKGGSARVVALPLLEGVSEFAREDDVEVCYGDVFR
jgi:hypothetical protein